MAEGKDDAKKWLIRARSNLAKAKLGKTSDEICFEDLCFDCQQAVEKSLKSLCILKNIEFPWTHNLNTIISLLENEGISIPENVKTAEQLSPYATSFRYPGDEPPVSEDEWRKALEVASFVAEWVEGFMESS